MLGVTLTIRPADLPAKPAPRERLSRSRSDRPPQGVDQRERGASLARVGALTDRF